VRASQPYDAGYEPAAPVFAIGLGPSGKEEIKQEVTALIDTGADVTMIPAQILLRAGGQPVEQGLLRGILGESVVINLYLVAVHIGGITVHGVRAAATKDSRESILGRDVLNQLELTLNGPAQELWVA
jgi:predicted aspartyl protease